MTPSLQTPNWLGVWMLVPPVPNPNLVWSSEKEREEREAPPSPRSNDKKKT